MKTKYQIANKWYQDRGIETGVSETDLCVLSSNGTIFVQVSETEVDLRCKEVIEENKKNMFNIKITSINVLNAQKGLYYYNVNISFDNVQVTEKYHTSFTKAQDTVEDAVMIATNYNSRDGRFQENMLKDALSNGTVTHNYMVDEQTKYNDTHGKVTKIN